MAAEVPDAEAIRKEAERLLRKADVRGRLPTPVDDIIAAADLLEPEHSLLSNFIIDQAPAHLQRAMRRIRFKVRAVLDRKAREVHVDPSIQHRGRLAFKKLHEVTHDILPWQRELAYADDDATLSWTTKRLFEWQANHGAAELLFQRDLLADMASQYEIGMAGVLESVVTVNLPRLELAPPPGPDGYRLIEFGIVIGSAMVGYPLDESFRYITSAAGRLDTAHRQFGRVREELDNYDPTAPVDFASVGQIVGDAQLAMIALYRALDAAKKLPASLQLGIRYPAFPPSVSRKIQTVAALRHAYEHIDERAVGRIRRKNRPEEARLVFVGLIDLLEHRRARIGRRSLAVDNEASDLMVATRLYLVRAWTGLCIRRAEYPERLGLLDL